MIAAAILNFFPLLSWLTSWNCLSVFAVLLYIYWWKRPQNFPPGPRGLPLLGVIPFLGRVPGETFKKWGKEKYGPIMSARIGMKDVVILNTNAAINQAFVKQSADFSDRPWIELLCNVTSHNGIVLKKYGDDFKSQKHFALKFLRQKGVANFRIEEMINDEGDKFVEYLTKYQNQTFNFKESFYWLTCNVICRTALGKRFDYGDPQFLYLLDILSLLIADPKDAWKLRSIFIFDFLCKIPPFSGAAKRFQERTRTINSLMTKYVEEHKKKFDPNNLEDFIDEFLYEQKFGSGDRKIKFTEKQLAFVCREFFTAGTETTSTTLSWIFVYFLNFPRYQKLILKEIDEAFGSEGIPKMSCKDQLPITCAFINEVFRIKTLTVFGILHATSNTTQLEGYVIPKGTTVIPNIYGAHMDPDTWAEPEKFSPERHLNKEGKFDPPRKVIPFSVGQRFCLGESLARYEIFIFFVKILQKFQVKAAGGKTPPIDNEIVSILLCPRECKVVLERRS